MAYLVHPLPPRKVWVKKEYLYDLEKGHGELTPGIWISVRSIQAKALYFETFNIIALDNGQFAAQPNNRCQFFDNSLVDNDNMKRPDFKVCTQNFAVETLPKWWSVGHTEEWAYRTKEESEEEEEIDLTGG